jgi:hypothetical protein
MGRTNNVQAMKQSPLKRRTPLKRGKKSERVPKGADTLERLLGSGTVQRASAFTAKRKPLKKRSPSNAGWWFIALEIWDEREHICEVCKVSLGDTPIPHYFSHLLPRGSYRRYKLYKPNLVLKCKPCHELWHQEGPKNLRHIPEWKQVCITYYTLRDQANELHD